MMDSSSSRTRDAGYTERLKRSSVWWKRLLDVQRPYRWNLRRLGLGFVLDVGCGIGRNLKNLGSPAIGVDHNPTSVASCREAGLIAFVPDEFRGSAYAVPGRFDALLLAHVVEHMTFKDAKSLLLEYLPYVRPGGKVVLIAPQEAGFRSDPTHVEFMDLASLERLVSAAGLVPIDAYSFPFARVVGKVFKYNEFVMVARRPTP